MKNQKIHIGLLIFILFTLQSNINAQDNLLTKNPGFESGKTGWYFDGSGSIFNGEAHSGSSCLRMISAEGGGTKFFFTKPEEQPLVIKSKTKYRLDAWIKPVSKTYALSAKVYSISGYNEKNDIKVDIKGSKLKLNEWQLISFEFNGNEYANAKFSIAVNLGEIYFDDVKLYEVND